MIAISSHHNFRSKFKKNMFRLTIRKACVTGPVSWRPLGNITNIYLCCQEINLGSKSVSVENNNKKKSSRTQICCHIQRQSFFLVGLSLAVYFMQANPGRQIYLGKAAERCRNWLCGHDNKIPYSRTPVSFTSLTGWNLVTTKGIFHCKSEQIGFLLCFSYMYTVIQIWTQPPPTRHATHEN